MAHLTAAVKVARGREMKGGGYRRYPTNGNAKLNHVSPATRFSLALMGISSDAYSPIVGILGRGCTAASHSKEGGTVFFVSQRKMLDVHRKNTQPNMRSPESCKML
jgi:hypothetical protein